VPNYSELQIPAQRRVPAEAMCQNYSEQVPGPKAVPAEAKSQLHIPPRAKLCCDRCTLIGSRAKSSDPSLS